MSIFYCLDWLYMNCFGPVDYDSDTDSYSDSESVDSEHSSEKSTDSDTIVEWDKDDWVIMPRVISNNPP
jgi:hypothetical protein